MNYNKKWLKFLNELDRDSNNKTKKASDIARSLQGCVGDWRPPLTSVRDNIMVLEWNSYKQYLLIEISLDGIILDWYYKYKHEELGWSDYPDHDKIELVALFEKLEYIMSETNDLKRNENNKTRT